MNILFDINHPVDVNFFKNSIVSLDENGHNVFITFRNRGKLESILRYELKGYNIVKIGEHAKGFVSKVITQLNRDRKIISYIRKNSIDLVVCFGSTAAISAWWCRKPYLAFDDDFEYKIPFFHANWFSTKHIYPDTIAYENSKTVKYKGFKELAYLHPNYLKTDKSILSNYNLKENKYVFVREIDSVSLNYQDENRILENIIEHIQKRGLKILLSLENKNKKAYFKDKDCIVLEEPVTDIYSLMYHALFAISSGDTVARETALMGVPTIYTGGRSMAVNEQLVAEGLFFEITDLEKLRNKIDEIDISFREKFKHDIVETINTKWEDTTQIILNLIEQYMIKN